MKSVYLKQQLHFMSSFNNSRVSLNWYLFPRNIATSASLSLHLDIVTPQLRLPAWQRLLMSCSIVSTGCAVREPETPEEYAVWSPWKLRLPGKFIFLIGKWWVAPSVLPGKHCCCPASLHCTMVFVRTSDFPRKKLGGCHSLIFTHPSVIYSELANPFDH